uniref:Uncharacterized protein n=1 Tax=Setaria digitata TaxID=48799 RepID=A0A915PYN8_9BILA
MSRLQSKWKGLYRTQRQILDTTFGVIVWKELTEIDFFSDYIWDGLALMIANLEQLIHWLTTYPAGLKLNAHLNGILSQFFVYHIYLWQSKANSISSKSEKITGSSGPRFPLLTVIYYYVLPQESGAVGKVVQIFLCRKSVTLWGARHTNGSIAAIDDSG